MHIVFNQKKAERKKKSIDEAKKKFFLNYNLIINVPIYAHMCKLGVISFDPLFFVLWFLRQRMPHLRIFFSRP